MEMKKEAGATAATNSIYLGICSIIIMDEENETEIKPKRKGKGKRKIWSEQVKINKNPLAIWK